MPNIKDEKCAEIYHNLVFAGESLLRLSWNMKDMYDGWHLVNN